MSYSPTEVRHKQKQRKKKGQGEKKKEEVMVSSSPKEMNPTLYKLIEIVFGAVLVGIAGLVIGGQLAIDSLCQAQVLFSFIKP